MNLRPIDRVLERAHDMGMNQVEFAEAMGVIPQHVTNWKRRGMPPERLQKAAEVLKCTVDDLLGIERGQSTYWPFAKFSQADIHNLPPAKRREIEAVVAQMIAAARITEAPTKGRFPKAG